MMKWELAAEHESTWRTNGLKSLNYEIINGKDNLQLRCSVITVDVKLNNHEITDSKCAL